MVTDRDIYKKGHIIAKPTNDLPKENLPSGVYPTKLDGPRDAIIYVPEGYSVNRPASLAVMLHGAGGNQDHGMLLLRQYADEKNIILVSPASRAATWDIIYNDAFGPDVIFISQALIIAFERFAIDTKHVAIGGFSDGASYALSIGLSNGDLFTHVIAFSPGFMVTEENRGKPTVFISHGVLDRILPIDVCSRKVVPKLQKAGYNVSYHEFEGEHIIPAEISAKAVEWFLST